ncbi:hypothetical protein GQR58_026647 [Nymphon striatum]|nr:hypothetical protein GQR58_026647 [Nymphon striatum]
MPPLPLLCGIQSRENIPYIISIKSTLANTLEVAVSVMHRYLGRGTMFLTWAVKSGRSSLPNLCAHPPVPVHASVELSSSPIPNGLIEVKTVATYKCDSGFELFGSISGQALRCTGTNRGTFCVVKYLTHLVEFSKFKNFSPQKRSRPNIANVYVNQK